MGASIKHLIKPHVNSGTAPIYPNTFVSKTVTGTPGVQPSVYGDHTVMGVCETDLNHNNIQPYLQGVMLPVCSSGSRVWILAGVGGLVAGTHVTVGASVVGINGIPVPNAGVAAVQGDHVEMLIGDDAPTAADGEMTWGDLTQFIEP